MADEEPITTLDDFNLDELDVMYNSTGDVLLFDSFCNLFSRELTELEFEYLISRYRFIDLAKDQETAEQEPDYSQLQRYKTTTGWWICDYQDRILTSPGRLSFGNYTPGELSQDKEDEDGDGGVGVGSLTQQSIDTMQSIFMLISARWDQVFIADGYYSLQRMSWMLGLENGLIVKGFEPNKNDKHIRNNILYLKDNDMQNLMTVGLTPSLQK